MAGATALVTLRNLSARYGRTEIFSGVSLSIERNSRWAVIGPNGAGKSTLVRMIAGLNAPSAGEVIVDGRNIGDYPGGVRARKLAYVPQKPEGVIPYTVHDFVMLGRYSSMGLLGIPSHNDREKVAEAVDVCDVGHLQRRLMNTLSGGELQRVLLAGAVAQETPILLLDEPTTFLDPAHEHQFFAALSRLHRSRELTTIMITHDLNGAMRQCSHVAALKNGGLFHSGTIGEFKAQCPAILDNLFGVPFKRFVVEGEATDAYGSWERV
jgi:ABC-type cobalamin/Fe3+-siderophores transport system ATPase subunit